MSDNLKSAFWERIADVQAGMLAAGGSRAVPMSPYGDRDSNAIWFITAQGTDLATAAQSSAEASFSIADSKANLYATVDGQVSEVDDPKKLDELWNAVAAAWFEDGREDKDIRLIRMTPTKAEVWATGNSAGFVFEIIRANLTGDTPDADQHGVVSFVA